MPHRALAGGIAEGRKEGTRKRVILKLPLGMPLHGERERGSSAHPERFDDAVGRARLDLEIASELPYPLGVERIHRDRRLAGETMKHAAWRELHFVRRAVLLVDGRGFIFAMAVEAGHFVQLLPERTAEGDVHLLEAATDREQRHSCLDDMRDQRQCRRVTVGIVERTGLARRPLIAMRLDVRGAAGQEDAVEVGEELADVIALAQGRNQHSMRSSTLHHRADVLLADAMKVMMPQQTPVGWNSDQGFAS